MDWVSLLLRLRQPTIGRVALAILAVGVVCESPALTAADTIAGPFPNGVVAADHPAASQAGTRILQQGGNAVDAAVATAFALSVCRPESSGLGGGGFMLIWDPKTQSAVACDYRERAPLRATPDMFVKEGVVQGASEKGGLAAAVPGQMVGLCEILSRYGTMKLADVLQPAIDLAEQGVPVDRFQLNIQRGQIQEFHKTSQAAKKYEVLWSKYLHQGVAYQQGEKFLSPQLPALRELAKEGPQAFRSGRLGQSLLKTVNAQGGIWTAEDLQQDFLVIRQPLRTTFQGHEVWTMPPPSSGGVALVQTLAFLEAIDQLPGMKPLAQLGPDHVLTRHRILEAFQHAFADRATYLGDADFVDVPLEKLLSPAHIDQMVARYDESSTQPQERYGRFAANDDAGTTHFSVIDSTGVAVACTETINTTYGSWVVDAEFGIVLNNEMDDFTARPGEPNAFGLQQSAANAIAPGKKPLSSMTPTIVVQSGNVEFAVGASGGPRIISTTIQILLNLAVFGLDPDEAVQRPRMHHQWLPREALVERETPAELQQALKALGHQIRTIGALATGQLAVKSDKGLIGVSDRRKYGSPAGY